MFEIIKEPQFWDLFGLITFVYIMFISVLLLKGKQIPGFLIWILFLIGVVGLMVDMINVYYGFLG
ncbi:MAG: hypothetical protein V1740_02245 [Candidatus Woesearchaeota archaeon]